MPAVDGTPVDGRDIDGAGWTPAVDGYTPVDAAGLNQTNATGRWAPIFLFLCA
jgi:hypothetical protein